MNTCNIIQSRIITLNNTAINSAVTQADIPSLPPLNINHKYQNNNILALDLLQYPRHQIIDQTESIGFKSMKQAV